MSEIRVISAEKKEQIRREAKIILADFAKSLEKVKIDREKSKDIIGGFREEKEGLKGDLDFRKRMFANAKEKNYDNIIVEKKKWL